MTILGKVCFVIFGLFMIADGLFMLVSPRAWCQLPTWISGRGKLAAEIYSHGWGAVQVRVLGVIMIGLPLYVAYDVFFYRA
jgi:hypothetical protein